MMAAKSIFVVTHGPKEKGPDPGMTQIGKSIIKSLKPFLPRPTLVYLGEAKRHREVSEALDLLIWVPNMVSSVFGSAGSYEVIDDVAFLVLPSGRKIFFCDCTTAEDMAPSAKAKLVTLPDQTIICAGREVIIALTGLTTETTKSGALYRFDIADDSSYTYELVVVGTLPS